MKKNIPRAILLHEEGNIPNELDRELSFLEEKHAKILRSRDDMRSFSLDMKDIAEFTIEIIEMLEAFMLDNRYREKLDSIAERLLWERKDLLRIDISELELNDEARLILERAHKIIEEMNGNST